MIQPDFDVIFCDDIRVEANGKHILVGVYPVDLVPAAIPQVTSLSLWIRARGIGAGRHSVRFRLEPPSGGQPIEHTADGSSTHDLLIAVGGLPVEIRGYGDAILSVAIDGAELREIARLPITPRASV